MSELSIIIVNYNTGDFLSKCLSSVEKIKGEISLEVVVVDNDSKDDSFEKAKRKFKDIKFVKNEQNLGFGKANNQILKNVGAEFILFLNPDTELSSGTISGMTSYLKENKDVGAATCKVVLPNGQVDLTAHRGFPTPLASLLYFLGNDSLYHLSKNNLDTVHEVDAISGAFFLTRKMVLDKVGYFDEDYFMYAEDIDLCFRIKQAGYKIMYIPSFEILHHKGVSSGLKKHSQNLTTANLETKKKSLNEFYKTMKIFYRKHYEKNYPFFINWLIYLGINLKWFLAKRDLTV